MLYDENLKEAMVDILEQRMSAIANVIINLVEGGYSPNKKKTTILNWSTILIHAYENVDILSEEQQHNLDVIYNKVLKL